MSDRHSAPALQHLVDQAASFDLFVVPETAPAGGAAGGLRQQLAIHRCRIDLLPPSMTTGVQARNQVAAAEGRLDLELRMIPWSTLARPGHTPPLTELDPDRSQRFELRRATFSFGSGDGFHSFGTGRTFPMWSPGGASGGGPRLLAAAVGNLTEGFGRLRGVQGNYTLCGDLSAEAGFQGHIMVRLVDPRGKLRRGGAELPALDPVPFPDRSATLLTWVAQKDDDPQLENHWSTTPEGEPRGVNIPVHLKHASADFSSRDGLRVQEFQIGARLGLEIGFGRETQARRPGAGTAATPFQFEGVSEYFFHDAAGTTVGSLTANFLEGRSIQMQLPGAPEAPALRFGYFGAVVGSKGCLRGAQGMIYGTAGSVFGPPPFDHVITNRYVARLLDPEARFRAT